MWLIQYQGCRIQGGGGAIALQLLQVWMHKPSGFTCTLWNKNKTNMADWPRANRNWMDLHVLFGHLQALGSLVHKLVDSPSRFSYLPVALNMVSNLHRQTKYVCMNNFCLHITLIYYEMKTVETNYLVENARIIAIYFELIVSLLWESIVKWCFIGAHLVT